MRSTRRTRLGFVLLLTALGLGLPSSARAFHLGVNLFGTVGGTRMQNVNDALEVLNAQFTAAMQPVRFEKIDTVTSWGVGLQSPLGKRFIAGLEWERLGTSTAVGGPLDRNTIHTDAEIYRASVAVDLIPENRFRFGFAGGAGHLSSRAKQTIFDNDMEIIHTDLDGSGPAWDASMFFAVPTTSSLDFSVALGWRWAKLDNLSYELTTNLPGVEPQTVSALDWTGVYGRAVITIFVL